MLSIKSGIKSRFLAAFFLFLTACPLQGMQPGKIAPASAHPLALNTSTIVCLGAGAILGAGFIQYAYNYAKKAYNQYLENKIINGTVEHIAVAVTPYTILTPEATVRKKAQLICARKRIMATLADTIKTGALSPQHAAIVQKNVKTAEKIFKSIDLVRKKNPFEHEYLNATLFDKHMENSVIRSILLITKPDSECTPQELKEKQIRKARKAKIVDRLKIKVNDILLNKIMTTILAF